MICQSLQKHIALHPSLKNYSHPNGGNIIWIRTPKCAGSSLKRIIRGNNIRTVNVPHEKICVIEGGEISKFKKEYPEFFADAWKFAMVRNPWDRAVSGYFFAKKRKLLEREISFKDYIKMSWQEMRNLKQKRSYWKKFRIPIGFLEKGAVYHHSRPLSVHLADENGKIDYINKIYKFEQLQECLKEICDMTNIKINFMHKNATNHKHYTEYYDDESKEIVAEKFRNDIVLFGYTFGE